MEKLSYTQEFYLCAINAKGDVPLLKASEIHSSFVAGALIELLEHGYVAFDDDERTERVRNERIHAVKPLGDAHSYLQPLYDVIAKQKKPRKLESMVTWEYRPRLYNGLKASIGESLVALGVADKLDAQGIFKNKTKFVPKSEAAAGVVERIRKEFLEPDAVSDKTVSLTALLDISKLLADYFDESEDEAFNEHLEEIRDSDAHTIARAVFSVAGMVVVLGIPVAPSDKRPRPGK